MREYFGCGGGGGLNFEGRQWWRLERLSTSVEHDRVIEEECRVGFVSKWSNICLSVNLFLFFYFMRELIVVLNM